MTEYIRRPYKVHAEKTKGKKKIRTLEGTMTADKGDYVVTGLRGEKWPVKEEIFHESYRTTKITKMKLNDLIPNPVNRILERGKIKDIKTAIEESGKIKPLVYTEVMTENGKKNMLTDGHHRYVALKEMGYKDVPAVMADERGIDTANDQEPATVKKVHSPYILIKAKKPCPEGYRRGSDGKCHRATGPYYGGGVLVVRPPKEDDGETPPTNGNSTTNGTTKKKINQSLGYQKETEQIRDNRKSEAAQKPHTFKAAEWTHPNGHPRCILCGDEQPLKGQCDGYESIREGKNKFAKEARDLILGKQVRDTSYSPASRSTFVKHPGHPDQSVHAPKGRGRASKKPSETFGRISSRQIGFIDQQVPGVKEYYDGLPKDKRPTTATDLVTQFEGLQERPASKIKSIKDVKSHLSQGTKVLMSAERSNLSTKENAKRTAILRRELKTIGSDVLESDSKYGGTREKGFVVSTNKLASIKRLMDKYNQDSVIVIQDGKAEMRNKDGSKEHGDVKETSERVGANDNYSSIGGVKFTIPFKRRKTKKYTTSGFRTPSGEHTIGERLNAPPKRVVKKDENRHQPSPNESKKITKKRLAELRDYMAKLNRMGKGYTTHGVVDLQLVREDLQGKLVEEHPGKLNTSPKKARKLNSEYNSERPIKNPEAHQMEWGSGGY